MDKTINDLHIRFPMAKLRDGTVRKLKGSTLKVYLCIAGFKRYSSNESRINYSTIKKYTGITSGKRIKEAIDELVKAELVESWVVQRLKKDQTISKRTKRRYKTKEKADDF